MKFTVRILCLLLSMAMFLGLLPGTSFAVSIGDSGFTKIGSIPNDYVATQGMCTDGEYIYTFKMISGNNNQARFYRTSIKTGETVLMRVTYDTSLTNFLALGHGNDMCAVVHKGVTYLYLATMYDRSHSTFQTHSIWKFKVTGSTIEKVAYYDIIEYGTDDMDFTGLTVYKQTDTHVTLMSADGKYIYTMEIGLDQPSGTVDCYWAFTINYATAPTPTGAPTYRYKDSNGNTNYGVQGMTYDNGKLYYVLTGSQTTATAKDNYIFCYDVENFTNKNSVEAIPSESIYVSSDYYHFFLEFESVDIHEGTMYFSANAGIYGYYEDYDFCGKLKRKFATTPEYTVTFCDESGSTLQSLKVKEGSAANFTGTAPTKAYDENNHYTFKEWVTDQGTAADLSKITGDLKVYPGFTATPHSYTESITTPPTCSAEGQKTFTCSCSRTYTEAMEALEHTPIVVNGKTATCTEPGYTGDTICAVCSAPIAGGTEIPVIPHSPVVIPGYAPTCSAEGLTDGSKCGVCGEILTASEVIPAKEHNTEIISGKAPTCLASGLSDGLKCVDCGTIVKAQQNLPRLGHDYVYANNGDNHTGTCSRCNKTTTGSHTYENGTCICGATTAPEATVVENITIGHTLNLASDISINYAVKTSLLEDYDSYYLEAEIPVFKDNVQTGSRTEKLSPVLNNGYYYFTLEGLNAVSMNLQVTATLHMTKDGKDYVSKEDLYSIATYAYAQLNKSNAAENLKVLCANLLRYGALAQEYKNYCTDNLPDAKLTTEQRAYLVDLDSVPFDSVNRELDDFENPKVTWVGKSLVLDSKVTLKFIFDPTLYGDTASLGLRIVYINSKGETCSYRLETPDLYKAEDNYYCFDFDGLLAADLRSVVSAYFFDQRSGERVSTTLEYSASTYGNGKSGTLLALCKALMAYSDTAKAYFTNEKP